MTPNENITVLLVEDEATLALIIKDTLDTQGFSIHIARDGEEGLRMYFSLRPDIIVADVMMPRMDGFDMVKRLRQTDPHIPVLFLTARTATEDVVHGFELGANDYLRKPFGMQELMIRLKALVGRACIAPAPDKKEEHRFILGNYQLDTLTQQLLFSDAASIEVTWCPSATSSSNSGATIPSSTPAAFMSSFPNFATSSPATPTSASSTCAA